MRGNADIEKLIGVWATDAADMEAVNEYGQTTLEFSRGGQLTYTIHASEKDQKIFCIYKVIDNFLITNQPSNPREEKTRFHFRSDGKLVLDYEGMQSVYVKINQETTF